MFQLYSRDQIPNIISKSNPMVWTKLGIHKARGLYNDCAAVNIELGHMCFENVTFSKIHCQRCVQYVRLRKINSFHTSFCYDVGIDISL